MKKTTMITLALGVVMGLTGLVLAQGKNTTISGNLVDKACSARVAKAANPQEAAAGHSKKCALSENCKASCYGVYSEGKFYELDDKGCELAKAALEKSTKEKGAVFKIVGKVDGAKIAVVSITETE